MGLYHHYIFPRLMDWVMSGEEFTRLRSGLLKAVHGDVLEIGFGTGLNLPHYPKDVSALSIVDPVHLLNRRVAARVATASFPVHIHYIDAESLPFSDQQFDCVVSTWTLCTIPDPVEALREVRRVLKANGVLLFLEHGRSEDTRVATWQDRLNPVQNIIGCGCHLNRRIDRLIEQSGLKIVHLERFRMTNIPRIGAEMYQGHAVPSAGGLN